MKEKALMDGVLASSTSSPQRKFFGQQSALNLWRLKCALVFTNLLACTGTPLQLPTHTHVLEPLQFLQYTCNCPNQEVMIPT